MVVMCVSETPYWQGPGNDPAPAPWSGFLINSDPTFSNCNGQPATCNMAWFEVISNSSDLFLYNGMVWSFFNNNGNCNGDCQQNAVDISSSSSLYIYGQNVKAVTNIFVEGSQPIASESANQGGWGGVVAAYLFNT
jgi:glucan 1,3-beta-glucosidase